MGRGQQSRVFRFALLLGLVGCGPDEDVELLALPPLEQPSPEARLGIPEVAGVWSFVGWEIIEGDSTSLDRTFPSFGELRFATQRLDSIAGSFVLGGSPVPVIGDVRRDGRLAFVTLPGGNPQSFVAGTFVQDTLWLELSSILPADEWPRDARAAFVRQAPSEPAFAWLRGARVVEAPPLPMDSLAAGDSTGARVTAPGTMPAGIPTAGSAPSEATPQQPAAQPRPPAQQPSAQPTPPAQQPSAQPRPPAQQPTGQSAPPPAGQPSAQPPAQQPPVSRPPQQQPPNPPAPPPSEPVQPRVDEPAPELAEPAQPPPSQAPAEDAGPLLGEPINP